MKINTKKIKLIEVPDTTVIDGVEYFNIGTDMASADPSAYGRAVKKGDIKKIKEMESEKGYYVLLPNGEYM